MGACMSSSNPGIEVSEEDKRLHREAEKALKEVRPSLSVRFVVTEYVLSLWQAKSKLASQVKVVVSFSPNPRLGSQYSIRCYFWGQETLGSLRSSRFVRLAQ
jgi:hypothetical protein